MPTRPLIDAAGVKALLAAPVPSVVLDCSFDLADAGAGERAYRKAHIPGAIYAHLERDLSGQKQPAGPGFTGRHPLPDRAMWAATVGAWGIAPTTPVVAYDAQGGPYAARAWWLLRWLGHDRVAVLDGGLAAWQAARGALDASPAAPIALTPYVYAWPMMPLVQAEQLLAERSNYTIVDARAGERFRGEVEPLDPVAGHIPGARNRFFKDNLAADGRFKPVAELRAAFEALGAGSGQVVHQCGSGVTACHNLLAMEHAGMSAGALYPGSWSEWCADPARPVAKG